MFFSLFFCSFSGEGHLSVDGMKEGGENKNIVAAALWSLIIFKSFKVPGESRYSKSSSYCDITVWFESKQHSK